MKKVFLTGITGLVGSAVVVGLSRQRKGEFKFVCLARGNSAISAEERVRRIIADECAFEGCPQDFDLVMEHVEVISGDIVTLDVEKIAADPVMKGVETIFHCAADVNLGKDPDGKTFRINYNGTENVLALAKRINAKEFHYVGTAYIAGKLVGTAYENNPVDNGFNNPYEESKFKAEMLVRASGIPFTVYRPGIVTGRRSDGRIRKPLAFYRILEFLGKVKSHQCSKLKIDPREWVDLSINFSAEPSEHVYFVPIDYVAEAIIALFPLGVHNQAYHLTGDSPVTTKQIEDTVTRVLRLSNVHVAANVENSKNTSLMSRFVGDLFPYFSSDIVFDQSNIRRDLGDGILDWEYGVKGLQTLICSYYIDHYPDVAWLQEVARNVPTERK